MFQPRQVLLVSSDPDQCASIGEIVRRLGMQSASRASLSDARAQTETQEFHLVLCSDELPDCNLRTAIRVLTSATGGAPVVVLSRLAQWDSYIKALEAGAFDYIVCPPDPAEAERILLVAAAQIPPPQRASHTAA